MKTFITLVLFLFISTVSVFNLFAQSQMEDVIYLKNGNVYRGIIVEQVPNVNIKIQTIGGNIFLLAIEDVEKITKENKVQESRNHDRPEPSYAPSPQSGDTTHKQYQPHNKGYFFQAQVLIENLQGGVRIVNGYKFNRFAYFGVGVGIDHVFFAPFAESDRPLSSDSYPGVYLPVYFYYSGDILNKRFTPFYAIEVGYAIGPVWRYDEWEEQDFNSTKGGGAMGGAGIGVKLKTRNKVNFSLLFNLNAKQVNFTDRYIYFDEFGNSYSASQRIEAVLVFPGMRFGIGF